MLQLTLDQLVLPKFEPFPKEKKNPNYAQHLKGIVLPHSSVSSADGRVLTGQSNAYADSELDLQTVLIARWQVNLLDCWNVPTLCTSVNTVHGFHFQTDLSNVCI